MHNYQLKVCLTICMVAFIVNLKSLAKESTRLDSLMHILLVSADNMERANALNEISDHYNYLSDATNGLKYAQEALELSQSIGFKSGEAKAWLNMGSANSVYLNTSFTAFDHYQKALEMFQQIGDPIGIANCYVHLSYAYFEIAQNYPKALQFGQEALKLAQTLNLPRNIADSYLILAIIYQAMNEFDKSASYLNDSKKLYYQVNDLLNLAYICNTLGELELKRGNLDQANKEFSQALKIYRNFGVNAPHYGVPWTLGFMAKIERIRADKILENGDSEQAMKMYLKSKNTIIERINLEEIYKLPHSESGLALADLYLKVRSSQDAVNSDSLLIAANKWLQVSIHDSKSEGNQTSLIESYRLLVEVSELNNNPHQALIYFKNYSSLKDSVENKKKVDELIRFDLTKAFEEKEMIKRLEQERKDYRQTLLIIAILCGLFISLFILILVLKQRDRIATERKISDDLLLNILPKETALELKHHGKAKTRSYESVTVLFTDFKGFTQVAENLTAEELVVEINKCYSAFDEITLKYGMEKIKTIGDSYMCAGGLPVENLSHPVDAVLTAMEMLMFIEKNKEERIKQGLTGFEVRIGIHTGPVVSGIVGTRKFAYDIWGDTVNIASRMESSGESGKINISEPVYKLIREKFQCIYRGKIQAKNKGEISMYFVDSII